MINSSATFITFATACGFACLWATYIVPETANVSLEEIGSLFESSAWKEEAAVKYQVDIFLSFLLSFFTSLNFFLWFIYIEQDLGLMDLTRELGVEDR